MLRFLADESCDFAVVRVLRAEGFKVLSIAEDLAGADDEQVIALALQESRILLTEDKDFGQLVFASGSKSLGVVLIRFPAGARPSLGARILELIHECGGRLAGSFVVLQPERIRISALP